MRPTNKNNCKFVMKNIDCFQENRTLTYRVDSWNSKQSNNISRMDLYIERLDIPGAIVKENVWLKGTKKKIANLTRDIRVNQIMNYCFALKFVLAFLSVYFNKVFQDH